MAKRDIPSVDALMRHSELAKFPPGVRKNASRAATLLLRGDLSERGVLAHELAVREAERLMEHTLRSVLNMSGVILHTGLGRARLAKSAVENVSMIAGSYSSLELGLEEGKRGDRQSHVSELLGHLTGCEDAIVVNNCASAVFLSLSALCSGKQVVISRGQLVEIGGSFRMPDIVAQSGCALKEVGCTNKTRLSDYEQALGPDTGAFLRCHPSNFKIVGFVEEPEVDDLAKLAHHAGILLIDDMGSGCLLDTSRFGLPRAPTLQEAITSGADVVLASGDKLLGGPQAGLILGRSECIHAMKSHPLARALRIDKLSLAALESTLRLYLEGREQEIPIWQALARPLDQVKRTCQRLARAYPGPTTIEQSLTEIGAGSLPGTGAPTWRLGLHAANLDDTARRLRTGSPAIVGRIQDGKLWLDPRTLDLSEVASAEQALRCLD